MLKRIINGLANLLGAGEVKHIWQPAVIPIEQRAEMIAYWSAVVYQGPEGLCAMHDALDAMDAMDDEDEAVMFG